MVALIINHGIGANVARSSAFFISELIRNFKEAVRASNVTADTIYLLYVTGPQLNNPARQILMLFVRGWHHHNFSIDQFDPMIGQLFRHFFEIRNRDKRKWRSLVDGDFGFDLVQFVIWQERPDLTELWNRKVAAACWWYSGLFPFLFDLINGGRHISPQCLKLPQLYSRRSIYVSLISIHFTT